MTHTIINKEMGKEFHIDETQNENTLISIVWTCDQTGTNLLITPKQLNDLIGVLLHVQAKKRKEFKTGF